MLQMNGVADWKVTARFRDRGGARGQYKAPLDCRCSKKTANKTAVPAHTL